MSMSHTALPPVRLHNPHLDSATRYHSAPARCAQSVPLGFPSPACSRLLSLVSSSPERSMIRLPSYKELTAASNCDDLPPRSANRSSLFTAGLIHLPPLKLPNSPPVASGSKSRYHSQQSTEEDYLDSRSPRYLDLSMHCPLPLPSRRVTSPYTDSLSLSETDSQLSDEMQMSSRHQGLALPRLGGSNAHTATSTSPVWPPNRGPNYDVTQPRLKFSHAKAGGRTKKQALSCYFCRERKIACGRPDESNHDQTCNQCARRKIECRYPTVSHRGQHSRIKSAARKAGFPAQDAHNHGHEHMQIPS
ncbi:hypothetical protein B0H16DRAFT_1525339 [Mycena metata]|uniref:Zn(2)-C6 fungal-type domain-containing protein n=1 Tax=Mycena metata TaxID=1033252 RepID=A0AAD7JKQ7_9AGAR|nr:hypothetical protein B0H16DRAFT_1525339 [Mycena metata]